MCKKRQNGQIVMQMEMIDRRTSGLPMLFSMTIFSSACLLFFVQPMFAKMVLPALGGSSAVWTTAMLFFQTVLILGYLYAHLSVRYLTPRAQLVVHLCVWALALAFLPIAVPQGWTYNPARPAAWQTLTVFALGVGAPFAALSATAPLLQAWYARSGGPSADDPYFLYAASNLGSLLSLLAFPFVAEPLFGVRMIGQGWAGLYLALGAGLLACGLAMGAGFAKGADRPVARTGAGAGDRVSLRQIGVWLGLAFLPSSLMLSTTSTIATDIGSFPLVWVIPLALYLASFVFAFSRAGWPGSATLEKLFLIFLIYSLVIYAGDMTGSFGWLPFVTLVGFFFLAAVLSHRRLYQARPAERHLTVFYVTMSVGGALGGLFNSILAPMIFNDVYEGPITLVACTLLLTGARRGRDGLVTGVLGAAFCAAPMALALATGAETVRPYAIASCLATFLIFWRCRQHPVAALVTAALVLMLGQAFLVPKALWKERSFFGSYTVLDRDGLRIMMHGTTAHGSELLADLGQRPTPVTYYSSDGPLARVVMAEANRPNARIGIVGLGVGALGCYRQPGQDWHFYEIDAAVDRMARNSGLFDFMRDCSADIPTHIGDARVTLAAQDLTFDLLVIDAYSSDAIPVHLMTTDAMRIYLARLAPDGVIAFHVSNRFFDLQPVLARIARDLDLRIYSELYVPRPDQMRPGELPSQVVILSRSAAGLAPDIASGNWTPVAADARPAWSDDYSNVLGALRQIRF